MSLSLVTTLSPKLTNLTKEKLTNSMKLTPAQTQQLSNLIANEFKAWMSEEMEYQLDFMKDQDELDWGYYLNEWDRQAVAEEVIKKIAPVTVR